MKGKKNTGNINLMRETLFSISPSEVLQTIQDNVDLRNHRIKSEALDTLSRCLSLFILYLTDTALEHAANDRRSSISVSDILRALNDTLFTEIRDELANGDSDEEVNRGNVNSGNSEDAEGAAEGSEQKDEEKEDEFDPLLQSLKKVKKSDDSGDGKNAN
ncbi:CCAAT-binding transcription factor, putative [Plasmodium ovale]|uniref:CCAAT-binding transcription factor, putative n=2 Tax=Plasmodium ovale TaxID=36330 RepID=A0A1A8W4V3_PLAOA|nr:CCAAT-binding transcription factor, putative [Plasmodium ovale curtisi]SBS97938.1 CCAAT-binding transcription factor, putative [Plasmodium ovale curtisi]SCQ16723.1 CCAAT-binding transcription factor, putative [Plasmodium ovale]